MRRALFLDRDGTLNENPPPHEYVRRANEFRWIPGAAEAVAALQKIGLIPIVVSNQRGVARGLIDPDELGKMETAINEEVGRYGGHVEAFFYCPHEITDGCSCRKPKPGLIRRAADEQRIDLSLSVMVGDSETDVLAGRAAGCKTVRLSSDGGATEADVTYPDLRAAAVASALPRAWGLAAAQRCDTLPCLDRVDQEQARKILRWWNLEGPLSDPRGPRRLVCFREPLPVGSRYALVR